MPFQSSKCESSSSSASSDEEPLYPSEPKRPKVTSSSRLDDISSASDTDHPLKANQDELDVNDRTPRRVRRFRSALRESLKCVWEIIKQEDDASREDRDVNRAQEDGKVKATIQPWRDLTRCLLGLDTPDDKGRVLSRSNPELPRCLGKTGAFYGENTS